MGAIKFGTDGWRAVIGEDFTFANLDRVSQATADYWKANPVEGADPRKVVVGYDRRFLSDQFAARVAEVLAGNGFIVTLTDRPTPTPSVSFEVKRQKAIGGVMLTASHNPPSFNGFKLKAWYGGSAEPAICQAVEALLDASPVKSVPLAEARKAGMAWAAIPAVLRTRFIALEPPDAKGPRAPRLDPPPPGAPRVPRAEDPQAPIPVAGGPPAAARAGPVGPARAGARSLESRSPARRR
jgi:hypothetical protein